MLFSTEEEYIVYFQQSLNKERNDVKHLEEYLEKERLRLNQLISLISEENFWEILPKILGIDAKLNLLIELIKYEDFSNDEILQITENDYRRYFKELCGYDLNTKTKHSIIFNIL